MWVAKDKNGNLRWFETMPSRDWGEYKDYVKMSVIFDEDHLLGYKDSPIDCGKETFLKLFKERKVVI